MININKEKAWRLSNIKIYQSIILLMEKLEVNSFFGKLSHYSEVIYNLAICNWIPLSWSKIFLHHELRMIDLKHDAFLVIYSALLFYIFFSSPISQWLSNGKVNAEKKIVLADFTLKHWIFAKLALLKWVLQSNYDFADLQMNILNKLIIKTFWCI